MYAFSPEKHVEDTRSETIGVNGNVVSNQFSNYTDAQPFKNSKFNANTTDGKVNHLEFGEMRVIKTIRMCNLNKEVRIEALHDKMVGILMVRKTKLY